MTITPKLILRSRLVALTLGATMLSPMLALAQEKPAPEAGSGRIEREAVRSNTYMAVSATQTT